MSSFGAAALGDRLTFLGPEASRGPGPAQLLSWGQGGWPVLGPARGALSWPLPAGPWRQVGLGGPQVTCRLFWGYPAPFPCAAGVPTGMAGMVGDAQVGEVPQPLSGVLWSLPGDSGASREVTLPYADSPQPSCLQAVLGGSHKVQMVLLVNPVNGLVGCCSPCFSDKEFLIVFFFKLK